LTRYFWGGTSGLDIKGKVVVDYNLEYSDHRCLAIHNNLGDLEIG
jgi:hypothetical protein